MTRARDLADLLDSNGDVRSTALDNATNSLSDLSVTATATELNTLDGVTATTAELNTMDGITASAAELNTLDGVTATTAELNLLDGVTATTAELNYTDGVTSNIQTQIDGINTDLVNDTTPQLGGDLDTNGNDVNFGDNDKAVFGAGNDLQVYHDGSNSLIKEAGTGDLKISGNNLWLEDASGNTYFRAVNNSYAKMYHSGSEKLATTSTGVGVTGTLNASTDVQINGASAATTGKAIAMAIVFGG